MPDDSQQEPITNDTLHSPERYYINKRIDSVERTMQEGFLEIMSAIKDNRAEVMGVLKDNKTQIHEVLLECQKNCAGEVKDLRVDVDSLKGYRNRAVGAVGVLLVIVGIWKVG